MNDVKNTILGAMKNIEKRLDFLRLQLKNLLQDLDANEKETETLLQVMKQHEEALKLLEQGKSSGKVKKQKQV